MAAAIKGLIGIDNVMRNINRQVAKIKVKSAAGLIKAAALVRRDMDMTPPLIPIDTGNLRSSWFVTSGKVGQRFFVVMGFSASYAVAVEFSTRFKEGKRPNSGPHFFEGSLNRNKGNIIRVISISAKL